MTAPRATLKLASRRPRPAQADLPLAPAEGVHLGMPHDVYHSIPAIGSSDLAVLAADPASWWYASRHNLNRRQRRQNSAALDFGRALHALALEGEAAFARHFAAEPDPEDEMLARNVWEVKALLKREKGLDLHGVLDLGRLHQLCREHGLAHRVQALAWEKVNTLRKQGKAVITVDEERRLRHMARLLAQHPDLGPGLRKGLPEVSVFWRRPEDPHTLLRARFDRIAAPWTLDLKTMANPRGQSPAEAACDAIEHHSYDLQLALYAEGRRALAKAVAEDRVWSWSPVDGQDGMDAQGGVALGQLLAAERAELNAIAREAAWRWVWVFAQVRSDDAGRERAPVIQPFWVDPASPFVVRAAAAVDRALVHYRDFRDRLGLNAEWAVVEPITELPVERLRRLAHKREPQP